MWYLGLFPTEVHGAKEKDKQEDSGDEKTRDNKANQPAGCHLIVCNKPLFLLC